MSKTKRITFDLAAKDAARLKLEAEAEGLSLSAHLRRILAKHLRRSK